ncbi:acylase [Aureibaculum sp. A20]|uniref:Acylase n=1 Tax=Aureibaculum flavum TaxID=2795986 RepID=A0ABS0WUT0_9FLAO|nr:acylase [Aureibaculum flavum]MBJ2175736.1 acylase [Aureibaculum flavum]
MNKLSILLLLLFIGCKQSPKVSEEVQRWQKQAVTVEIIRDNFGVPHIYGKTDADAVFGLLYAQCEDDFNRVEQNYIWATGRLAEVEGEEALYSDLRAKLYMTKDEAIANYEKSPEWLKKLCNAFADGINYYLFTHPEVTPRLLTRFEPWMPMYFSEGSIGGDIEGISTKKIGAFYGNENATDEIAFNETEEPFLEKEPAGSNGFAISGKRTASGNAMLLINPHTSFFFRGEVHMVSEEGLNAYGAVTWGQFFIYQGFNEKTGWMHTSTYTDIKDEFLEDVTKTDNGYTYTYGDEQRPVKELEVALKYKVGDSLTEKKFNMFRTHRGPITHAIDSNWVTTAIMWDPVKALEQSFTRTKLNGHQEFREMMNIRTNSSNNTVYADAGGNIAYYHGNFIPKRNVKFDYTNPVDGSDPETDWNGLHTVDENITVINPEVGWIQNCNSTPFTSAGENSPKIEDYPNYMSKNRENFRGVHAIRLLEKSKDLTIDKLITMAYDPYLPAFEISIPGLIQAYDKSSPKDPELTEAIDVLRKWDFSVSKESVAMSLAHFYGQFYLREGNFPNGLNEMEKVAFMGTKSPKAEKLTMLKKSISHLTNDFGSWNTPWGEINRYQRLNGDIDQKFDDDAPSIAVGLATSRWGALAAFGMRSRQKTKRIYGTRGNSFVAVVEFGDKVKAKSMLAGGQSGDPDSPHFDDQAQRYADVEFKNVPYYREDVEARAEKTYHPGE